VREFTGRRSELLFFDPTAGLKGDRSLGPETSADNVLRRAAHRKRL